MYEVHAAWHRLKKETQKEKKKKIEKGVCTKRHHQNRETSYYF